MPNLFFISKLTFSLTLSTLLPYHEKLWKLTSFVFSLFTLSFFQIKIKVKRAILLFSYCILATHQNASSFYSDPRCLITCHCFWSVVSIHGRIWLSGQALTQSSMENSRGTRLQQSKGRRLVLFPLPLKGHLNPMLELANILHSKGFSITIIHTHFNAPNSDDYPHFTFHPISDGLSEGEASTGDILHLLLLLTVNCVEPFRDCLARLLSNVSEEPVACLVADAIWHFSRLVADSLKLPTIVLRTSSASSFLVFGAFPLLREKGYLPIQGMWVLVRINLLVSVCDLRLSKTTSDLYGLAAEKRWEK